MGCTYSDLLFCLNIDETLKEEQGFGHEFEGSFHDYPLERKVEKTEGKYGRYDFGYINEDKNEDKKDEFNIIVDENETKTPRKVQQEKPLNKSEEGNKDNQNNSETSEVAIDIDSSSETSVDVVSDDSYDFMHE